MIRQQIPKLKAPEGYRTQAVDISYVPMGSSMTWIQNSAELAVQLHSIFEDADIPYYIPYYIPGGVAAIASGNRYDLSQHNQTNIFTVVTKDNHLVARFDSQGRVLSAEASLLDRQQWQDIAMRVSALSQRRVEPQQER